jgi:hypothetical protein
MAIGRGELSNIEGHRLARSGASSAALSVTVGILKIFLALVFWLIVERPVEVYH